MLLKGKTAVITGSNKGIGKVILELFAENGANVIACSRKETPEFVNTLELLKRKFNISIIPVYFDLEDSAQIKTAITSIISLKSKIDILVNNAGYASGAYFQMTPIADLERMIKVNFTSQIQFTQGISRYMVRFKSGSIINMGSTAGLFGDVGMLSYGSSKAALIFATKTMATELGQHNIRVNVIAPSVTKTEMYDQMEENARNKLIESSAFKRAAEPIEVANVALFLASDLSTFVNGQTIRVDGGITP
jgi:3-oxoacyl-[acyl-carrier protein] reductase